MVLLTERLTTLEYDNNITAVCMPLNTPRLNTNTYSMT